jgi:hypothetical protein
MSDNHPFAMLTIHDDDYTLSVQWLTLAEPMLLIGISSLHNDGLSALLMQNTFPMPWLIVSTSY